MHSPRWSATITVVAAFLTSLMAQPAPPTGRALFYTEPDFRGECIIVDSGGVIENLEFTRDKRGRSFNDRISSVRIEGPVRVGLFEHSQFRGQFTWLDRDARDLTALSLGDRGGGNWNEAVSSVQVDASRRSSNAFIAWQPRDAERAVRATYRDIFGRDPDPTGVRYYTGRLLDAGWSEEQLRDALRRSDEFRNRDLDAIVRRAFREILGREADPSGVAAYTRALSRGMTEPELRAELGRSREGMQQKARELITRVYRELLKREPDPAGLENYTAQILQGKIDETKLRDMIRKGDEFRQQKSK